MVLEKRVENTKKTFTDQFLKRQVLANQLRDLKAKHVAAFLENTKTKKDPAQPTSYLSYFYVVIICILAIKYVLGP